MNKKFKQKSFQIIVWALFVLYLLIFVRLIVLKSGMSLSLARLGRCVPLSQRILGINFIPFKTITYYLKCEPNLISAVDNLLGNILAYVPLGIFLPLLFKKCRKLKNAILISFCLSFSIEVLQLIFFLGITDIDDIILNVSGSLIGFLLYHLLDKAFTRKAPPLSHTL